MELHEAWLFLEEASAERIIEDVLIPHFAPSLKGKLRTFSAGGAGNVAPSVAEFQRLIVFVHLQQVYRKRIWVRADGDQAGTDAIKKLRAKFDYFTDDTCASFTASDFEIYYPSAFDERVKSILEIAGRDEKKKAKLALLHDVLTWSASGESEKVEAWGNSAAEIIDFLQSIEAIIANTGT
jgi:hypothetical protein